jgi:hypothetical protein
MRPGVLQGRLAKRVTRPDWYGGLAVDAAWRLRYGEFPTPSPTWTVPAETREAISIRWPERYDWDRAWRWVYSLRESLSKLVDLEIANVEQRFSGHVLLEVRTDGETHAVAIDYRDRNDISAEAADACALVFKMQFSLGGYGRPNVIPGGYVQGHRRLFRYLVALRRLRASQRFRFDAYGRFNPHGERRELRQAAVDLLQEQDRFRYEGSFGLVAYPSYLREIARARVCVDLPGYGDLCHRLVDYLAIGSCVIRPRLQTRLHVPLVEGEHIVTFDPDLADMVPRCAELVEDESRRERIARAARDHYDRYLHPTQLAGYYLHEMVGALGSSLLANRADPPAGNRTQ